MFKEEKCFARCKILSPDDVFYDAGMYAVYELCAQADSCFEKTLIQPVQILQDGTKQHLP